MTNFLPAEVQEGLAGAQLAKRRKKSRLRVRFGASELPVLRIWDTGFSVEADQAQGLHGLVDLYDGTQHVSVCLIVASEEAAGERRFEFKRATPARDQAPVDFARETPVPSGLLEGPKRR